MDDKYYINEVDSTNNLLWKMTKDFELPEGFIVYTDFQNSGKGQVGNVWESEVDKNLLFSMLLMPRHIAISEQFLVSQIVSVSIKKSLEVYTDEITVKWPNDIYWKDKKIAGILIENSLQGSTIKSMVVGVGINVNQTIFRSAAPNPVSLAQIIGKNVSRENLLEEIRINILDAYKCSDFDEIRSEYLNSLYRKSGYYSYRDDFGLFDAEIKQINPDGQLLLKCKSGELKGFYFKEVEFVK